MSLDLALIREAALEAGRLAKDLRAAGLDVQRKPDGSLVRSGGEPSIGSSRAWRGRSRRGTERSSAIV